MTTKQLRRQLATQRKARSDAAVSAYTDLITIEQAKETDAYQRKSYWQTMQTAFENFAVGQVPGSPNHIRFSSLATYCSNQKTAMNNLYLDYGDNIDALLIKKSAAESAASTSNNYLNSCIAEPGVPTGFSIYDGGGNPVVGCHEPEDNGGEGVSFEMRYSVNEGASWTIFGSVYNTQLFTPPAYDVTVYYQVRASNSAGSGNWSETITWYAVGI